MAVLESCLDFLRDGVDGGLEGEDGEGVGEGKKGLQGCNGLPQSWMFPAKEECGNLSRV